MQIIVTARLTLRSLSIDDVDCVHAMWTDAAVRRHLWDNVVVPRERAEEMVRAVVASFEASGRGMWLIFEKGSHTPCGFCGFLPPKDDERTELIYGLLPSAWGRGYATESARAVIAHAFQTLGVGTIFASCDAPNAASVRVLERLGMRFVRRAVVDGIDLVFYEISSAEWRPRPATDSPDTAHR
jgi:[ribosomal protein S5]-alanine N-acetyltransferase